MHNHVALAAEKVGAMVGWAQKLSRLGKLEDDSTPHSGSEKRDSERVKVPIWAHIRLERGEHRTKGYIKNISKGGAFVETSEYWKQGDQFEFQFMIPQSPEPIVGTASVAWVRQDWGTAAEPPGMGIQFIEFKGRAQKDLDFFISRQMKAMEKKTTGSR